MSMPSILLGSEALDFLCSCLSCNLPFLSNRKKKLCSPTCQYERQKIQIKESQERIANGVRKKEFKAHKLHKPHTRSPRNYQPIVYFNCQGCEKFCARAIASGGNKFCSKECLRKWHFVNKYKSDWVAEVQQCLSCKKDFLPKQSNQSCCSRKCNRRMHNGLKNFKRKSAIGLSEPFDPIIIFERDGWHCKLCGIETPQSLRGTYEKIAPELDHIIPISKGGSHTIKNSQCACRKCNISKGNKLNVTC